MAALSTGIWRPRSPLQLCGLKRAYLPNCSLDNGARFGHSALPPEPEGFGVTRARRGPQECGSSVGWLDKALGFRHSASVDEAPVNEWERAYKSSIEAEHEANLRAEEAHARQMAMMPLKERRRRRRTYFLILLLMGPLFALGVIVDGVASHRVVTGHAVNGTAVLVRQVSIDCGRGPCGYTWQAHFVSDDGTIDRTLVFAEDVPSALGVPGTRVNARWTSVKPDSVYLAKSRSFRNWAEGLLFFATLGVIVAVGVVVVLRRRARLRRTIEAETRLNGNG